MANNNLAHPYANAIFETAKAENTIDGWLSDLAVLSEIAQSSEFSALVNNPRITQQALRDILLGLLANPAKSIGQLLSLLQENDRLQILPEIYALFEQKVEQDRNTAKAIIQSAYPLNDVDKSRLEQLLSNKFGKSITASVEINRELIGGLKVLINDTVIDASVKGSLNNLATQLIR